jgi:hypothetical protein
MPPIDRPPVSPQAQAQMGPPGGAPGLGPGFGEAMQKSPVEIAVSTCEKILLGVQDESFRAAAVKFIAQLKVAAAESAQKGPQSSPMGAPSGPGAGAPPPQTPKPPTPGQMPG